MFNAINGREVRMAYSTTSSTYTVPKDANMVTYTGTQNATMTMFEGTTVYETLGIKNASSKTLTVSFVGGQQIYDRDVDTTLIIPAGDGVFIQWDGTYWCIVGSFSAKYFSKEVNNVTANRNFQLFGKNALLDLFVSNSTANSVTINIGTTANGTEIVNGQVVGANAFLKPTVNTNIFASTTTIYISSASWNSANLDLSIDFRKI